jgi:hypothetical protein
MLVVQSSGPQSEGGYTSRQFGWNMGPYSPGFGAIVDSNQQIYPTLSFGVGPGLPVSYSQTYGDGPVEPGLYVYASGSNILSANLSWRVGRNTNIGREVGVGTPSGGIGVQLVFPALRGTTREDIEYRHADYGHHGNWGGGHRW